MAETIEPNVSCITMVTKGFSDSRADQKTVEQTDQRHQSGGGSHGPGICGTELVLLKVNAKTEKPGGNPADYGYFPRGQVVDVGLEHYTISITGDAHKVRAILNLLKPFGIREIARTGSIAMFRENQAK
ncbi:MAG: acetolactate synthase small subunit [Desulfobacterales bacterium]